MSLHTLIWLALFLLFTGLTFRRSSWGIPLYLLVVYASPAKWWWAEGLLLTFGARWHLAAALIFAVAVFLDGRTESPRQGKSTRPILLLLLLYLVNASAVCFLFADNPEYSWFGLQLLWKEAGLLFLMLVAIKDKFDLDLLVYSIIIGCAYLGYESVFNDAFSSDQGREGGNHLAAVLCMSLPLGGYVLFFGDMRQRGMAVISLVLAFETTLSTVSRGAYLAMIGAGAWLIVDTKGRIRRIAIAGVALAPLAAYLMMSDTERVKNLARFSTTFSSAETRDSSTVGRIEMWGQALKMIADHPLGSGYEAAFRSNLGFSYIAHLWDRQRICHNSYLSIAASWGVQGLLLFLALLAVAWRRLGASISRARASGNEQAAFLGCCIRASLVTLLITGMFGSHLSAHWAFLWIAMAIGHERALLAAAPSECETEGANVTAENPIMDQMAHLELER